MPEKSRASASSSPPAHRITFAPVAGGDFEALAALRIAAMRESLERVGRFDPERARERLRKSFYPEHTSYIVLDGQRIGFYTFRPTIDGFQLDHFYIHPAAQGRGIGSFVLQQLFVEADRSHAPIHLGTLKESGSNRFYQRHSFVKQREGEWDVYYMRPATRVP